MTIQPVSQHNIDIAIEIHSKHSPELYGFVRKGTDLEGFKACVRRLYNQYYSSQECQAQEKKEIQFRCCNKFGESLMHLACRRGRTDMVRFLLEEDLSLLSVSAVVEKQQCSNENDENNENEIARKRQHARNILLSIYDDYNKTPFHDACWTPTPNFELILLLLKYVPEQILIKDIRGNTPFDYVRRNDYPLWLKFIWSNKNMFNNLSC
jgi:ankyrin repeat protein